MPSLLRRAPGVFFGMAVVAALVFGGSRVLAGSSVTACNLPGEIGSCPPFTPTSCGDECFQRFGTFGNCSPEGCCTCQI